IYALTAFSSVPKPGVKKGLTVVDPAIELSTEVADTEEAVDTEEADTEVHNAMDMEGESEDDDGIEAFNGI
ncbi:hypothetical protein C0992_004745, partial [Termitomyces sp. T32_za158]